MERLSQDLLKCFQDAAQSMKLYRRAELIDEEHDSPLIEQLYVDPQPNDNVLRTVLRPNTTFIIGRKGTGKSTVFQRAQYDLRTSKNTTSAYVDIKTVYEGANIDPSLLQRIEQQKTGLPSGALEQLLLHHAFLSQLMHELRTQLENRLRASWLRRVTNVITGRYDELFEDLDELLEQAQDPSFFDVAGLREVAKKSSFKDAREKHSKASLRADIGDGASIKGEVGSEGSEKQTLGQIDEYSSLLMRVFDIKKFIADVKGILARVGVRHLYIFVDDFSELPQPAMRAVVDVLLAPLNNWSDEFIKFKIAGYPNRIYYGAIDRSKVDEVNLDLYRLYGLGDVGAMEDKAIDFTRRLVERRMEHFCGQSFSRFVGESGSDVWRQLFYASMANPRTLGYLLYFLYETQLIYGRTIGVRAISEAAQRYFEEKIGSYFEMGKFLHISFAERSSIYSLRELLESIINRARELRSHSTGVLSEIPGRPPTSHFHVALEYENLLATLELNFFVTTYFEMADRDGRRVVVYALNYGLCSKYSIAFGRPTDRREHRLYFVERVFDYTSLLVQFMKAHQEIVCSSCAHNYDLDQLSALRLFGMRCPNCPEGTCVVTNLSKKYEPVLTAVDEALLLPRTELGILQTIHASRRPMFAQDVAGELDCSYQLVGKRARALADRGLITRDMNQQNRREYELTKLAQASYFDSAASDLELQEE
jgi:DNA-binding MarR family transcriptional regulator